MRPDMGKLLCEKERRGSSERSVKYGLRLRNIDLEADYDYPTRAKSCRWNRDLGPHDGKSLSDFLSPLYGFVQKSVGRYWDDVYSEICQNLDFRSVHGIHIKSHLDSYVELNTYLGEDGKVHTQPYKPLDHVGGKAEVDGYYVHPITGILCYKQKKSWNYWKEKRAATPKDIYWIGHDAAFVRIAGNWFQIWFKKSIAPEAAYYQEERGPYRWRSRGVNPDYKDSWPAHWVREEVKFGSDRYHWVEPVRKKSLNKKEIARLKVLIGD